MAEKSKILIIGATGYIGKFIAESSARHEHPTFLLIRETTLSNPEKSKLIQKFNNYPNIRILKFKNYPNISNGVTWLGELLWTNMTMAYAALTSLAGVIDQILPDEQRYVYLCDKDQMKSLHEKVSLLQEFLEYISLRSFSTVIDELESRIRDTAYKIEDTIELVIMPEPRMNCCVQFFYFIFKFNRIDEQQLPTSDEFGSYFEEVDVLLEEAMEMKKTLNNNVIPLSLHPTSSRETTGSKEGTKVGLDKALNEILDQVTRQGSKLRIVPITGMGGIGKTTLARASFEAPKTLHHFDVRFWVTVSQDYNVQDILRGLVPEAERSDHRLIEHVHKNLTGRRYLIVLDDMWDEKVWDRVRNAFPDDNKGSRIIITTRLSRVASYVGSSSHVHEMQLLNEDQSWDLLRENVYGHDCCCSTEFEDIGRIIAKNCKGLPLAVVVIAGLLKFNKTIDYWKQVARNTNEKVITRNDHLFEILSWSYTRLPPHLKACFLYMGIYKEDNEIPTKELVRLWAAEGFLKPKQSKSMEEVADECLEELVERSLVLVTKRWYHNGKIRTCSVHDLIREVSMRKAEEEKFHYHFMRCDHESTFRNVLAVQRRVSIIDNIFVNFPRDSFFPTTHSLKDNGHCYRYSYRYTRTSMVQRFKLLRVLTGVFLKNGASMLNILTLTNLRYLQLYFDDDDEKPITIPVYISNLQNLETLIVSPPLYIYHENVILPLEIWKLQRLRHLVVTGRTCFLVPLPNQDFPNLQTFNCVMTINFTNSFAQRIPNVRKLKMKYTFYGKNTIENLQYLHQLEELSIHCHFPYCYDGPLSTNLVFPHNLKKLSLCGTNFPMENLSPIGLLPNLKDLKLLIGSVIGEEWEPNEGEFLQLEHLKMEDLCIHHWRAESIHFPCLRKLVILDCPFLEEVPESIGEIDTLEMLILKVEIYEREAKKISVQKIKENQQAIGNDLLQVIILENLIDDDPF